MIMMKSSDLLQTGADRTVGFRWVYADVTDSARDLARSHLCGPAAELALAESLAAVALLGADLEQPEETVSFQMKTDGPIGSVLVEAAFDGALRGFPAKKILAAFDGEAEPETETIPSHELPGLSRQVSEGLAASLTDSIPDITLLTGATVFGL